MSKKSYEVFEISREKQGFFSNDTATRKKKEVKKGVLYMKSVQNAFFSS